MFFFLNYEWVFYFYLFIFLTEEITTQQAGPMSGNLHFRKGLISAETYLAIPVVSSTYFSLLNYYH